MSRMVLPINSIEDGHRAIHTLSQSGFGFRVPLISNTLSGRIAHMEIMRQGKNGVLKQFLAIVKDRRPTIILIGDDDDEATGPAGWPNAEKVLRWAKVVVLHAAGGERCHYEAAVEIAVEVGPVAMVECGCATLPAWFSLTKRLNPTAPIQIIVPPEGIHPAPAAPGPVQ